MAGIVVHNGQGDRHAQKSTAFSENLYVYAKATRGWHHRISSLDSQAVRAFALTPE